MCVLPRNPEFPRNDFALQSILQFHRARARAFALSLFRAVCTHEWIELLPFNAAATGAGRVPHSIYRPYTLLPLLLHVKSRSTSLLSDVVRNLVVRPTDSRDMTLHRCKHVLYHHIPTRERGAQSVGTSFLSDSHRRDSKRYFCTKSETGLRCFVHI